MTRHGTMRWMVVAAAAMACARRSAVATSVLPVSSLALSGAAEPITPILIRIDLSSSVSIRGSLLDVLPGPTNVESETTRFPGS